MRVVWKFPLRFINGEDLLEQEIINANKLNRNRFIKTLSKENLKKKSELTYGEASVRKVKTKIFIRNPYIKEYTKKRARGVCELCNNLAPFKDKYGEPYLESHHIKWLSRGGIDSTSNTVALCPNYHKKMHIVNSNEDIQLLEDISKIR